VATPDNDGASSVTTDESRATTPRVSRLASITPAKLGLAALFAFIILAQGISAPFQKDAEPQSAEWIQSIARDGHWLIPRDSYGFVDRKPPLFYWLSATAAKLSGGTVDEVRARVVSLVAGTALSVCVLAWTAGNVGIVEGWLAFLFLLGTYGFASRATEALTDMLLTFVLFAAYSAIYPLLETRAPESRGSPRRTILVGVILGLGVLTKGPVALVICALSALIYLILTRRNPLPLIRESWPWQLLAVSIVFGAIWYVPAAITGGQKILRIIFAENFGHFMPTKLGGTGESYRPFYFIAARLLGGAFPMTLLIVPAALAFYTCEIATEKRTAVIYQASMPLAVLLFFSIASVKRDDYILPALPGIAILCASVFTLDGVRGAVPKFRDVIAVDFTVGCAIAFLATGMVAMIVPTAPQVQFQSSDAAFFAIFLRGLAELRIPFVICGIVLIAAAVLAIRGLKRSDALALGGAFGLAGLSASLLWTSTLKPDLATMRSVKNFVSVVTEHVKDDQLCIPTGINYELSYYYGAAVPDLSDPRCASGAAGKPIYLLATPRELNAMTPEYRARLKLVMKSNLIGGGGPPSLYEISREAAR
jgi:4-amino-4-deoxy-L-arabinose transferase-like glycosyltransferase